MTVTAVLFALLLQSSQAQGVDNGRVSVVLNAHQVEVESVTLVFEHDERNNSFEKLLRPGSPLLLDLPEGTWSLELADGARLWHARQDFFVPGGGTSQVVVDVWPRSALVGKIAAKTGATPQEVKARFEPASPLSMGPSGEVRCPVEQTVFRCDLPAGEFNVRLRPAGSIAHYVPGLSLAPGGRTDLGSLVFREGQSITGRVQFPRKFDGDVTAVSVTAQPSLEGRGPAREPILAITGKPEKNGFFHLDGVAPGAYAVRAAYGRSLYSPQVTVEVRAGKEAELVHPLVLDHPRHVRLTVSPPLDVARRPWHVRLAREHGERALDPVTESNASAEGAWQSPRLAPGRYVLTLGTMDGDVWHEERIDLVPGDFDARITIAATHDLRGTVTVGDDPLPASLTFSHPSAFRITTRSDESGKFAVAVPKTEIGTLAVQIESDVPTVQRRIQVKVPANRESIEIALPGGALLGELVDARGAPVADALVYITNGDEFDGLVQPESDAEGRFEAHGLAPGSYSVMAVGFMTESEPVTVEVKDDAAELVRLVLREANLLRGRIVSSYGGVPGARVHARAVDVFQMMTAMLPTNANGEFTIPVPGGARLFDLTVAAPGFSCLVRRVKAGDRPLNIEVEQSGGVLTVLADANEIPHVVHDGGTVPITTVSHLWPMRTEMLADGSQQFVVAMMAPGGYSACSVEQSQLPLFMNSAGQTGGRCVQGYLAPFGALTLDVRAKGNR